MMMIKNFINVHQHLLNQYFIKKRKEKKHHLIQIFHNSNDIKTFNQTDMIHPQILENLNHVKQALKQLKQSMNNPTYINYSCQQQLERQEQLEQG